MCNVLDEMSVISEMNCGLRVRKLVVCVVSSSIKYAHFVWKSIELYNTTKTSNSKMFIKEWQRLENSALLASWRYTYPKGIQDFSQK